MVRYFPGDDRHRVVALLVACLLALGALTAPLASAKDDLKDKQRKVEKKIDSTKESLEETSARLRAAQAALQQAQAELSRAQARLAETRGRLTAARIRDREMQAKLDAAVAELARARQELEQGKQDVAVQRREFGKMVAEIYELGDPQLQSLASILDAQDAGDMTRSIAATDAVMAEENAQLDELKAAEVLLTVQEENVEEMKEKVEVQRRKAAEHLEMMKALEAQAEAEEASVRVLVDERQSAMREASRAKARDRRVLGQLRAEEARIADELRRRAAALAAKARNTARQASDGFLSYPVDGYVTSPYGYRRHPIYGYYSLHNGIDFGAGGCGAPLYASANGRVMDRYYDGVYGNRLVLDHGFVRGVGLASIYNHASHYVVTEGQRVRRGQVIGYMGTTGWSTGCHLHYTVMVNGRTVDPMNWF